MSHPLYVPRKRKDVQYRLHSELLREDIKSYISWHHFDQYCTYTQNYIVVSMYAGAIMQFLNNKAAIELNTDQPTPKLIVTITI